MNEILFQNSLSKTSENYPKLYEYGPTRATKSNNQELTHDTNHHRNRSQSLKFHCLPCDTWDRSRFAHHWSPGSQRTKHASHNWGLFNSKRSNWTHKVIRRAVRDEIDTHRRRRGWIDRWRGTRDLLSGVGLRCARLGLAGRISCLLRGCVVVLQAGQAHVERCGLSWAVMPAAGGPLLAAPHVGLRLRHRHLLWLRFRRLRRRGRGGHVVDKAEVLWGRLQHRRRRRRGRRALRLGRGRGRGQGPRTGSWFGWRRGALGLFLRSGTTWFLRRLCFDGIALMGRSVYTWTGIKFVLGSIEDNSI